MADDIILVVEAVPIDGAENQITQSLQSRLRRPLARVRSQEAHAQRLLVESGRVQALVVEATSLVDGSVVADAEIVRDVRPTEHGRVQHLQVTHLRRAGLERLAILTGRVVHDQPRGRQIGQRRI